MFPEPRPLAARRALLVVLTEPAPLLVVDVVGPLSAVVALTHQPAVAAVVEVDRALGGLRVAQAVGRVVLEHEPRELGDVAATVVAEPGCAQRVVEGPLLDFRPASTLDEVAVTIVGELGRAPEAVRGDQARHAVVGQSHVAIGLRRVGDDADVPPPVVALVAQIEEGTGGAGRRHRGHEAALGLCDRRRHPTEEAQGGRTPARVVTHRLDDRQRGGGPPERIRSEGHAATARIGEGREMAQRVVLPIEVEHEAVDLGALAEQVADRVVLPRLGARRSLDQHQIALRVEAPRRLLAVAVGREDATVPRVVLVLRRGLALDLLAHQIADRVVGVIGPPDLGVEATHHAVCIVVLEAPRSSQVLPAVLLHHRGHLTEAIALDHHRDVLRRQPADEVALIGITVGGEVLDRLVAILVDGGDDVARTILVAALRAVGVLDRDGAAQRVVLPAGALPRQLRRVGDFVRVVGMRLESPAPHRVVAVFHDDRAPIHASLAPHEAAEAVAMQRLRQTAA